MVDFLREAKIPFYETGETQGGLIYRVTIRNSGLTYLMQIHITMSITHFDIYFSKANEGAEVYNYETH